MESASYGIFALVVFVSENSCVNTVPAHFPWSNLYVIVNRNRVHQNYSCVASGFVVGKRACEWAKSFAYDQIFMSFEIFKFFFSKIEVIKDHESAFDVDRVCSRRMSPNS